ncbi:metal homeostatis BSD2 family protein [Bordetella sp. LUAb4]|uniref:metal homeostatis BSD2 family protein n=1 Tax=Bordetella sp. LUAb4 TaxID=2843195 RepID=UPI001E5F3ABE|nr:metal homeostatis BSD2 family protein [Bordetella sp. LUAb4]
MTGKPSKDQESEAKKQRHEGTAKRPEDKVPTYQEALDDAVEDSFPASDPISPGVAEKADREVSTSKDDKDWKLKPGSETKKS